MGEVRLNAHIYGVAEVVDYIDLREPVNADKIIRNREALKQRVALQLGGTAADKVEVTIASGVVLSPVDLPGLDEHELGATLPQAERHLSIVPNMVEV